MFGNPGLIMSETSPGSSFQESSESLSLEEGQQVKKLKMMPHSLEAERSVLGGILLDNRALFQVVDVIQARDFYRPAHAKIFQAQLSLMEKNEPIDEVTLITELKAQQSLDAVGGPIYVASLCDRIPTAANIASYAKIVHEKSVLRQLISAATDIVSQSYSESEEVDQLLDQAESIIFNISEQRDKKGLTPVKEVIKSTFKHIETLFHKKESITGVPSGYEDLDKILAGFQPSDLVIIAARPSVGKTALALNVIQNSAIRYKKGCAIFSLEMSKEQLALRMLCSEARIDGSRMRGGFLTQDDWPRLARAAGSLSDAPIFIDDSANITILELRAKCRRLKADNLLDMIIIDYLQLMKSTRAMDSREREISEISRGLKGIAKELSVPVIALSQLNRSVEQRQDKRPMMSDLRESGAIEQDADVIAFIYRDEVYNPETPDKGVAEVIIAKQRNGPIGTVRLRFFNEFTRYENLAVTAA